MVTSALLYSGLSMATLTLDKVPKEIKLEGNLGGKVDGSSWSSAELVGKVHVLFYAAPSKKNMNEKARDVLKAHNFPQETFGSLAVVNMKASLWPNGLIAKELKKSQEENPRTLYIKDIEKTLVNEWALADNSNDVVVFNKEGKVIFSVDGKLSDEQVQNMMTLIKKELAEQATQKFETNEAHTHPEAKKH
jgi:YtfJ family uncharacterized protein